MSFWRFRLAVIALVTVAAVAGCLLAIDAVNPGMIGSDFAPNGTVVVEKGAR